jgi:hypothetical protein
MTARRKPLDPSVFANAAVAQLDPVQAATTNQQRTRVASGQTSRAGKVQVQGYFPEDTRRRLKVLAAQQGRTLEDLLGEAIADLMAKHRAI